MTEPVRKGYGYVVREHHGRPQVLVFDHVEFPDAGTQVPGGTLEEGEGALTGILREVLEESGLADLVVVRELGMMPWFSAPQGRWFHRYFAHLEAPRPLPETWVHEVSSGTEDTGLLYHYFWMDLEHARQKLAGGQGQALHLVAGRNST